MSKIGTLLKDEMLRLARKELRGETRTMKRTMAQQRRDIAALKRQLRTLTGRLAIQEKSVVRVIGEKRSEPSAEPLRFSAKGLRSNRQRLGLSAADFAKLVGVTQLSIYNWERGVARPREEWLKVLASLRSLGKKEAEARLEQLSKRTGKRRRS